MKDLQHLKRLFDTILAEAGANPTFAQRLSAALAETREDRPTHRPGRRKPGVIDPFALYSHGEEPLRQALGSLGVEQLKDIVAEHGMDLSKLAMKWKTPGRLIDLIAMTVRARSQKGDAFRGSSTSESSAVGDNAPNNQMHWPAPGELERRR
jgi:hypothetical protein